MADFALTLSPVVRAHLLLAVQGLFLLFVLMSFICVAGYTAKQIRLGNLFAWESAPTPLILRPPALGWLFIVSVLALIYLQSPLYAIVVMAGFAGILLESGHTAIVQFGFQRLQFAKAFTWGLLIFGAVTLVETPLMQSSIWVLDKLQMPHPEQQSVETFRQYRQSTTIAVFLIQAVLVFPIVEELFFRGFLMTFLKNYTSTVGAIILSAGVFAFAHSNLAAAIPLWFLGIVLGVAYEHTGSLLVPMTVHCCFNLATGLSLLIEKGNAT